MGRRCSTAKVLGIGKILDFKLTFKGVTTIKPEEKKEVPVVVWKIEESDEEVLDIYEGYPYLYRKETIRVEMQDKTTVEGMVYIMNSGKLGRPSDSYLRMILMGYEHVVIDRVFFY